jgi:hypothetical protein
LTRQRNTLCAADFGDLGRAAIVALVPVLLGGCPDEARDGHPARGEYWQRYDSLGHQRPGSTTPRGPDDVVGPTGQARSLAQVDRRRWEVPVKVKPRAWKYIVLHHSATDEGSAEAFDKYHRKVKGWKGLAYHFVIGNGTSTPDGAVEVGYRWKDQKPGAHAGVKEYNHHGIGICLVGDFEHSRPTKKQIASLRALLGFLRKRFGLGPGTVVRHRDVGETKCPGKNFPWPVLKLEDRLEERPGGGPDQR